MKPIYLFMLLLVAIVASAVVFTPPDGGVVTIPPDPTGGHATGIPTVTTNVTYWTFVGLLTKAPNDGSSGIAASPAATATLRPGSTDLRGIIDLYAGSATAVAGHNLATLIFSKPFATPPFVACSSTFTNANSQTPLYIKDVTTTNALIGCSQTMLPGQRYIGTYQVMP